MKITHIDHSGFIIELQRTVLIFDWYEGELPPFEPDKKVFVFVTQSHADHYSPRIWSILNKYKEIYYVLECCTAPERKGDNIFHVQPGRHYKIRNTLVYAIRSNDEGVAYVVNSDNQNAYSLKIYRRQIEKISGWNFDAAMLPLDPRLGESAPNAIVEFLNTVECRFLFPMNYWNRTDEAAVYLNDERLLPFREKICLLDEATI